MKALLAISWLAIGLSVQAAPAKHQYQCYPTDHSLSPVELVLQGNKAILDGDTGTWDRSYTGGQAKYYDRFTGFRPVDGEIELLVQKRLRQGAGKGKIRIQVRGEGFNIDIYDCYARD